MAKIGCSPGWRGLSSDPDVSPIMVAVRLGRSTPSKAMEDFLCPKRRSESCDLDLSRLLLALAFGPQHVGNLV